MFELINSLIPLIISFSLVGLLPIGIVLGVVFAFKLSGESDLILRKQNKHRMWWSFLTPFIVIILVTVLNGLLQVIHSI